MTTRITTQGTYYLTYDQENRLTGVSGAATATFVYDGDGNRVKGTVNGVTTTYIGSHFEWTGSTTTAKKYYYAGATRVAMCEGSTLYYLLGDHLGSTSLTLTSSGGLEGEVRYGAWGADRYTYGDEHTSYGYTGQRSEDDLGLYYYGARWYDAKLGRFIQPDTIVPLATQGVQALDRFAYCNNNPLRYNDPSGHGISTPEAKNNVSKNHSNEAILAATVVIGAYNSEGQGSSGLATVTGENMLVTMHHFTDHGGPSYEDAAIRVIRDQNGNRAISNASGYITRDNVSDSMMLTTIDSFSITPAPLANRATMDGLAVGDTLAVVSRSGNGFGMNSFTITGIDNGIATIADPNNIISPGDSGGPACYNGMVVGWNHGYGHVFSYRTGYASVQLAPDWMTLKTGSTGNWK